MKNELQISRRPKKGDIPFLSPKSAEEGGNYIFNYILMKNENQVGRRPKKGVITFLI
jgi:hypothetical protein